MPSNNISKESLISKELSLLFGEFYAKQYLPVWFPQGHFNEDDSVFETQDYRIEVRSGKFRFKETSKKKLTVLKSNYVNLLHYHFKQKTSDCSRFLESLVQTHENYKKYNIGTRQVGVTTKVPEGLDEILVFNNFKGEAYAQWCKNQKTGEYHIFWWDKIIGYWSETTGMVSTLYPLWNEQGIRESRSSVVVLTDDPESVVWLDKYGILSTTWLGSKYTVRNRIDMTCLQGKKVYFWPTKDIKNIKKVPDFFYKNLHGSGPEGPFLVDLDVPGFGWDMPPHKSGLTGRDNILKFLEGQGLEIPLEIQDDDTAKKADRREELTEQVQWFKKHDISYSETTGSPLCTASNIVKLLENLDECRVGQFGYDPLKDKFFSKFNFSQNKVKKSFFFGSQGEYENFIINYLETRFPRTRWTGVKTHSALEVFKAHKNNRKNQLRGQIEGIKWDNIARLHRFSYEYLGYPEPGEDTAWDQENPGVHEYLDLLSRKLVCSVVHRLFEPGCYLDNIIVFFGPEGIGKTKFFHALSGGYLGILDGQTSLKTPSGFKDGLVKMSKNLIVLADELSFFQGAKTESINGFLTQNFDEFRAAYGRGERYYQRTAVIVGTTNRSDFIPMDGEGRRWIVTPAYKGMSFKWRKMQLNALSLLREAYETIYVPWLNSRKYPDEMPPWEGWCHKESDFTDMYSREVQSTAYRFLKNIRDKNRYKDDELDELCSLIIEQSKGDNPMSTYQAYESLRGNTNGLGRSLQMKIGNKLRNKGLINVRRGLSDRRVWVKS